MTPSLFEQWTLYRYRYTIGYILFAITLLFLVLFNFTGLPAGLSEGEMQSATAATELGLETLKSGDVTAADLPYHVLQKVSLDIFGATTLGIRLPSVLLAIMAGVILERLLKRLFHENVAIISTIMSVSTILFLTVARLGEPVIMSIFLTIAILYLALRVVRGDKALPLWVGLLAVCSALNLYSPLGLVTVLLLLAVSFHPKIHARFRALPKANLIVVGSVTLLFLLPLIAALTMNFAETGKALVAFGDWQNLGDSLKSLGALALGIGSDQLTSVYALPLTNLTALAISILGLVRCCRDIHAARSRLLLGWIIILLPIFLFNSNAIYLLFVPFTLLMGIGVGELMSMWNGLFPINPYARVAGLIPICILMLGTTYTTADRYLLANNHEQSVVSAFDQTPVSVAQEAPGYPDAVLVVSQSEKPFYSALYKTHEVRTTPPTQPSQLLVTQSAYHQNREELDKLSVVKITTAQTSQHSLLLRVLEVKQ